MRRALLVVTLVSIAGLVYLTVAVIIKRGLDPLVVLSLLILALFGFGIVGALRHPPPPD